MTIADLRVERFTGCYPSVWSRASSAGTPRFEEIRALRRQLADRVTPPPAGQAEPGRGRRRTVTAAMSRDDDGLRFSGSALLSRSAQAAALTAARPRTARWSGV
jgi:hypothetical protein